MHTVEAGRRTTAELTPLRRTITRARCRATRVTMEGKPARALLTLTNPAHATRQGARDARTWVARDKAHKMRTRTHTIESKSARCWERCSLSSEPPLESSRAGFGSRLGSANLCEVVLVNTCTFRTVQQDGCLTRPLFFLSLLLYEKEKEHHILHSSCSM